MSSSLLRWPLKPLASAQTAQPATTPLATPQRCPACWQDFAAEASGQLSCLGCNAVFERDHDGKWQRMRATTKTPRKRWDWSYIT